MILLRTNCEWLVEHYGIIFAPTTRTVLGREISRPVKEFNTKTSVNLLTKEDKQLVGRSMNRVRTAIRPFIQTMISNYYEYTFCWGDCIKYFNAPERCTIVTPYIHSCVPDYLKAFNINGRCITQWVELPCTYLGLTTMGELWEIDKE